MHQSNASLVEWLFEILMCSTDRGMTYQINSNETRSVYDKIDWRNRCNYKLPSIDVNPLSTICRLCEQGMSRWDIHTAAMQCAIGACNLIIWCWQQIWMQLVTMKAYEKMAHICPRVSFIDREVGFSNLPLTQGNNIYLIIMWVKCCWHVSNQRHRLWIMYAWVPFNR